jgi:hypothetical protein
MGSHPINLLFRFLLELMALFIMGLWGWKQSQGSTAFLLALTLPILLAVIWGVFAVPDDPSRSGKAPIVTPGIIRLVIELGIFIISAWALYDMGYTIMSIVFSLSVGLHYILSYDRIVWLLSQ